MADKNKSYAFKMGDLVWWVNVAFNVDYLDKSEMPRKCNQQQQK